MSNLNSILSWQTEWYNPERPDESWVGWLIEDKESLGGLSHAVVTAVEWDQIGSAYRIYGTWASSAVNAEVLHKRECFSNNPTAYAFWFLYPDDMMDLSQKVEFIKFVATEDTGASKLSWKVREFEIGDKVRPISKSIQGPLSESNQWGKAQSIGQEFLYVRKDGGWSQEGKGSKVYTCNINNDLDGGDYFLEEDLEPYYEKESSLKLGWSVQKEDKDYPEVGDNVRIIAPYSLLSWTGVHPDVTDEHWREQSVVTLHPVPRTGTGWGSITLTDGWSYPLSKWREFMEIV